MSRFRPRTPAAILGAVAWLGFTAGALAAHARPGALYTGKLGPGVGFKVSRDAKTMSFRGRAAVGLVCGSNQPPTGSAVAQFNLTPQSVPRVKIGSTGHFHGLRREASVEVYVVGHFTGRRALVFSVRTAGGGLGQCSSPKYKLSTPGGRLKRRR